MRYLVDTDWVADYLKGRADAVTLLTALSQDGIAISLISYGEIYEGLYFGPDPNRYEQVFLGFLHDVDVLPLNEEIMKQFALLRGDLRAKGKLIGDLDLVIAVTALHHRIILVTRNTKHFE